jgi:hypothetical protein
MIKSQLSILSSVVSHMPLLVVWQDSGVTQHEGFELAIDVCNMEIDNQRWIDRGERAGLLLTGEYDFVSGLHHETYVYRARGDKRFVYLAQAQNDWDDRIVARPEIVTACDLEGNTILLNDMSPCVFGNLRRSLQLAGADVERINFLGFGDQGGRAIDAVVRGEASAANVDIPFDRRGEHRGLHRLALPSLPVIHNITICANRAWIVEDEDSTVAFLKSMVRAIHFFRTEPDRVCEILERRLSPLLELDGSAEVEYLQRSWAALLSPKPYPHPLAVWNVYNLETAHDPAVNFIGPMEIWDTSYLRSIDDSGLIDDLYGDPKLAANPAVESVV